MKLLPLLKILMIPLTNLRVLLYLNIALRILMTIIILLTISKGSALQDSMEEEIAESECSLDEKEEESDEQKEEEWSHPFLPSNESNSLTLTLYDECYDPMDSFEISLLMKLMPSILMALMPLWMMLT